MKYIDNFSKEEVISLLEKSNSFKDFLYKIGYAKNMSGNTYKNVKDKLLSLSIDLKTFENLNTKKVIKINPKNVFVKNSSISQRTLRKYYILTDVEYKCSICGQLPFWNNKPLTLILDHINGINDDNRLNNLRFVCPNCNQQLETTGSKNIKKIKKINHCSICNKEIYKTSKMCNQCANIQKRKCIRPSKEELALQLKDKSISEIGRFYGVSHTTIRRWCKSLEIKY